MTAEQVKAVARSDEYADRDRVWCAAWLLAQGDTGRELITGRIAEYLGWSIARTETAVEAAIERGLLGTPKTRAEGRPKLVKAEDYTVQRAS